MKIKEILLTTPIVFYSFDISIVLLFKEERWEVVLPSYAADKPLLQSD
jgi:hypothetical protein